MRLRTHVGVTVAEPGELVPGGGDHYRVFTPYWRVWSERPPRASHPAPRKLSLPPGIRAGRIPSLRLGAEHFARLLVDADLANNVGNWQWVAGTGNDTRANRVLNPLRQAHRFDPRGAYVRRHVPELAALQGGDVHEPWRLEPAERRCLDYPNPVVDHEEGAVQFRRLRESGQG